MAPKKVDKEWKGNRDKHKIKVATAQTVFWRATGEEGCVRGGKTCNRRGRGGSRLQGRGHSASHVEKGVAQLLHHRTAIVDAVIPLHKQALLLPTRRRYIHCQQLVHISPLQNANDFSSHDDKSTGASAYAVRLVNAHPASSTGKHPPRVHSIMHDGSSAKLLALQGPDELSLFS